VYDFTLVSVNEDRSCCAARYVSGIACSYDRNDSEIDVRIHGFRVAMNATVGGVPQKRGIVSDADQARILTALGKRGEWEAELRESVITAAQHGASVRELAALTGLSTNTISRWKRGE
jgi:hypothetical protein